MRNQKKMLIEQLDRKLEPFHEIQKIAVPEAGWINNIRLALGITLEQLGNKLNMSRQGIKKIEERESMGSITLNSLKEVGKALDMNFVYGFVPIDGSVKNLVDIKARNLAEKIFSRTNQNMKLENQEISKEQSSQAIEELADAIKREMRKSLWD